MCAPWIFPCACDWTEHAGPTCRRCLRPATAAHTLPVMSNLFDLFLLLVLGAGIGLWLKLSAAREQAVREADRQCAQHGLQLLDETVGLRALRWGRGHGGRRVLERCYAFEVSVDGDDRKSAHLWMFGSTLSALSLPTPDLPMPPFSAVEPAEGLVEARGNVVPLRRRADRRQH